MLPTVGPPLQTAHQDHRPITRKQGLDGHRLRDLAIVVAPWHGAGLVRRRLVDAPLTRHRHQRPASSRMSDQSLVPIQPQPESIRLFLSKRLNDSRANLQFRLGWRFRADPRISRPRCQGRQLEPLPESRAAHQQATDDAQGNDLGHG